MYHVSPFMDQSDEKTNKLLIFVEGSSRDLRLLTNQVVTSKASDSNTSRVEIQPFEIGKYEGVDLRPTA
jgi:hypothetical protein